MVLVIVAALMSIVMNWIRVTTIILAGYLTDMQHYLVTVDHYAFGWVLFAVLLIPLFWFARKLEDQDLQLQHDKVEDEGTAIRVDRAVGIRTILAVLLAAVAPLAAWAVDRNAPSSDSLVSELPASIGSWVSANDNVDYDIQFDGSAWEQGREYTHNGLQLAVIANRYGRQQPGAELVNSGNKAFDSAQWRLLESSEENILVPDATIPVRRLYLVDALGERRVTYYWYVVNGKPYSDARLVKVFEILQALKGNYASGLRLVTAVCDVSCATSESVIESFIAEHSIELGKISSSGSEQ
jgi:EpsI family protein